VQVHHLLFPVPVLLTLAAAAVVQAQLAVQVVVQLVAPVVREAVLVVP
jgi:hypothetical protein